MESISHLGKMARTSAKSENPNRCVFDSFCHWFLIKFLKLYLVSCQFICRVFKLILVKLLIVCVFTIISQGAPLGLAVEMN